MNEITYQAALRHLQTLWAAGAGQPDHNSHAEFHTLYLQVTTYEAEQGIATAPETAFQIDSPEKLEWYVGKKADLHSRKARLDAQYKAMLRDMEREEERLDWRFAAQAETVLRQELTGKKRSLKFLTGTVGLRKVAGRLSITDEGGLMVALQELGGSLEQAIVQKVDTRVLNQLVKVDGTQAFIADEGTVLELPGVSVKPESEAFYVKGGKEE